MSSMATPLNAPMLTGRPELDPFQRVAPLKVDSRSVSSQLTNHQITCTIPPAYWGVNFLILQDGEPVSHWNDGLNGSTWTGKTWVKMPIIYPSKVNELDIIDHLGFFPDASDPDDTLVFYEDFNGSSFDTDKWAQTGTITKSQSGGVLAITSSTGNNFLYSRNVTDCGPGTRLIAYFRANMATSTAYCYSLVGFMNTGVGQIMFGSEYGLDDAFAYTYNGTANQTDNITWTNADYHTIQITWTSGTAQYVSDGSTKATHTSCVPSTSDFAIGFFTQTNSGDCWCSWIYAFKYDTTTPTGVLG